MFILRKCDAKERRCDGIQFRVTPSSLVHRYTEVSEERLTYIFRAPWRWRQRIAPKRWYLHNKLHDVITPLTAVRTPNLTSTYLVRRDINPATGMEPFSKKSIFFSASCIHFSCYGVFWSSFFWDVMLGWVCSWLPTFRGRPVGPIFKGQAVTSQKSEDFNYPAVEASNLARNILFSIFLKPFFARCFCMQVWQFVVYRKALLGLQTISVQWFVNWKGSGRNKRFSSGTTARSSLLPPQLHSTISFHLALDPQNLNFSG